MKAKDLRSGISYEQVKYDVPGDVKPIITNLVYTYPHWHNEVEIVFICKGSVSLSVGGEQYQLSQGEFAVINSTEIHAVNSAIAESRSAVERPDGIVFLLQISSRFMRGLHLDIESVRYKRFIENPVTAEEVRQLLLLIIEEVQAPKQSSMAVIHGFSGAIVAILTKGYCLPDDMGSGEILASRQAGIESEHNLERLKRILSWIHERYNENPSLGEAAATASVSPYYLSHIFTANLGMTYSQYVNSVRIDMARQDLLTTSDRVIDIMLRHGFSNAKTFNRVFKNTLGYSPTEYRKISTLRKSDGDDGSMETPPSRTEMGSYVSYKDKLSIPEALYRSHHSGEDVTNTVADREIRVDWRGIERLDRYPFKMTAVARASDLLQAGIRQQIIAAREEFGFEYVRFHGIFNDEMGILQPFYEGRYNFRLIDEVFDFLLGIGMRPFVELSFMPSAIASGDTTVYYYRGNVTPPRDWEAWRSLVEAFVGHLALRYSREEIRNWYFEVWNEPNYADFWTGSFEDYLNLYRISARAIKAIDPFFRVGGPALCDFYSKDARAYLERFLSDCGDENLPLDFVSGHPYPSWIHHREGSSVEVLQGPDQTRVNMEWIRDSVRASPYPDAEIHLDEWNSSTYCRDLIHDTAFMAPFILRNYLSCQGLAGSLCYWTLSDRFEEIGMPANEFHGGFGLLSMSGLKKPQYHALAAIRRLGGEVLSRGNDYVITRDSSGGDVQVLVWNYAHYQRNYAQGDRSSFSYYDRYGAFEKGEGRHFRIFLPSPEGADWLIERATFDRDHGSVFDAWLRNGALEYLTPSQIELLREQCVPARELSIRTARTELVLETVVEPHGFTFFIARRLNSKNREG